MNNNRSKPIEFRPDRFRLSRLTRRELLARSVAVTGSLMVGGSFVASTNAVWAMQTQALSSEDMATLIQMARDIYPHDNFGDELYAVAVKGHGEKAASDADYKTMMQEGIASLNAAAQSAGFESYLATGWESDRVAILKSMESDGFFQTVRGGLVVSLYNQPEVWALLGYEGSSFEHGGYISRGFDDIAWL